MAKIDKLSDSVEEAWAKIIGDLFGHVDAKAGRDDSLQFTSARYTSKHLAK